MTMRSVALMMLAATAAAGGCVNTPHDKSMKEIIMPGRLNPAAGAKYPRVNPAGLVLAPTGRLEYAAGSADKLPILLHNIGYGEVYVEEWRMLDDYNVELHYRRIPFDRAANGDEPWQRSAKTIPPKSYPRQTPLRLKVRNIAQLELEMPFVAALPPGTQAKFEVVAVSRLDSLTLRSAPFIITAR